MKKIYLIFIVLLVIIVPGFVKADIKMPLIFGNKMVLQRDIPLNVWGWADPGEKVSVTIESQTKTGIADSKGNWKVNLDPIKTGGPYEMIITGKNKIIFSDVLTGDVWICSGQSNMEMRVCHVKDAVNEIAEALYPKIRLFQMKNELSAEPMNDCTGSWEVCRPSTVMLFSAVGYFFGRELEKELDIPIGLINASWGGTPAETWMSADYENKSPEFAETCKTWEKALTEKPAALIDYYRIMAYYEEDIHQVIYANKPWPKAYADPPAEYKTPWPPQVPTWVYNGMINPIIDFGIKGAIWYQGESNASRAYQYRNLFPAMIKNWREKWNQGNFPFLYVQIANFQKTDELPVDSAWAELREAQLMTLAVPNTGMAVAIDIGEADDIHPRNKQDVGKRLALSALRSVYGKDIVSSGPLYKSSAIKDGKVYIEFNSTGSGLISKNGESLQGFSIAGKDKKFVWAKAEISGNTVIVSSDKIPEPESVRYAWSNNPVCNLYNKEGLPASPFRTDDWPGITFGKK